MVVGSLLGMIAGWKPTATMALVLFVGASFQLALQAFWSREIVGEIGRSWV